MPRIIALAAGAARLAWRHRRNLQKLLLYVRIRGIAGTWRRLRNDLTDADRTHSYQEWVQRFDTPRPQDLERLRGRVEDMRWKPLISVVMPVYNTPPDLLRRAIDSVRRQVYPHWQLCIADDASTRPDTLDVVREAAASDQRIRVEYRQANGHIAVASNSALALAEGEFVALLDHDDELAPHALFVVAESLAADPDADILYSDEDKLDGAGRRCDPYFKPAWDPDLFLGQQYLNHLTVYRRRLLDDIGGFRTGFDGSQDYDLALRAVERTTAARIRHLPFVLYHWRIHQGAGTFSSTNMDKATAAARRAISEHLERTGNPASVNAASDGGIYNRVTYPLPDPAPLVSLLVPTRDRVDLLRGCVDGLLRRTDYPALEVLVLDNDSREPETLAYFADIEADPRVRVLPCPGPFNFAAVNNAGVAAAHGSVVGFINNDIEVIDAGWLREMAAQACRPEVGAVGAKLLYGDGTVQHGGVILGIGGVGAHAHKGFSGDHPGYFSRLRLVHAVSAVTAACLVMRKAVFAEVGGFDADNLAVAFNDVDLCLKVGASGYRVLWTPHATLHHLESASRGSDFEPSKMARFAAETMHMRRRWSAVLDADPCYNPNLTVEGCNFAPAFPPRIAPPWQARSPDRDAAPPPRYQ